MAKKVKELSESDKIRQEIVNAITTAGDKAFGIRQAQREINELHAKVDDLRLKLEGLNGPKDAK